MSFNALINTHSLSEQRYTANDALGAAHGCVTTPWNRITGIGPNRLIAKLASEHQKPDGLVVIRPEQIQAFLDPMPVTNLRGVGPKARQELEQLGVYTVEQLKTYSLDVLQGYFGNKGGQHLYNQARGIASGQVGTKGGRQSISKETTFNEDVTNQGKLRVCLRVLASEVGQTARRKGLKGQVVTMRIRLEGFETHTRQRKIREATNADGTILNTAWELYQDSGFADRPVRLIGLGISEWGGSEPMGDLFDAPEDREREERLYATMGEVTEKFGEGKISLGLKKRD